ncbi:MAG: hypothetical protein J2P47_11015 [Acetobacteraceae bacterium]|nr:hypothetical protein [Acetobacteraceae bacterium]
MRLHPAVTVYGIEDAEAALSAGRPVTLLSARGAALYAGCGWWRAVVARASAAYPDVPMLDVLDCADASGRALAAIRAGQQIFILAEESPGFAAVSAIAEQAHLLLLTERPRALDLSDPRQRQRLSEWLCSG